MPCDQSLSVGLCLQDYKFLCVAVMIWDKLVNTHTQRERERERERNRQTDGQMDRLQYLLHVLEQKNECVLGRTPTESQTHRSA